MFRFLLNAILFLFVVRLAVWTARLLTSGFRREGPRGRVRPGEGDREVDRDQGGATSSGSPRARVRVDRSAVTDVPFTELPAEPRSEER